MGLFQKKREYAYHSNYGRRKRLRLDRVLVVLGGAVVIISLVLVFFLPRMKMMWKGYTFSETSEILTLTDEEENQILSYDKLEHIEDWLKYSQLVDLYEKYEVYWQQNTKVEPKDVVEYIDTVYSVEVPQLRELGYTEGLLWDLVQEYTTEDLQYLIERNVSPAVVDEYRKIEGYQVRNTESYMQAYDKYKDYNYSVAIVNYPFIISSNGAPGNYLIQNPEEILALVKAGFYLPMDYEPDDLVTPDMPLASTEDMQVRKVAASALEEMTKEANKAGYELVLNSAYRSYQRQEEVYDEIAEEYGGLYAQEYVAWPGSSEHQTGLGVDLTSQSVLAGTYSAFGDTPEYTWVEAHAYEYGFIIRFPEGTADKTGIALEPWHLRYVGKEAAKEIHDKGWLFEEYCLYHNLIPEVVEK